MKKKKRKKKWKARKQKSKKDPKNTFLIVGLGNPGIKYQNNRHNLGHKAVELFCAELGLQLSDQRFQALITSTNYHGRKLVLAFPITFMNKSGIAVKHLADHYEPKTENIMVVHDDIDLDVGRIRIVNGGGAGGHHGVESVIHHLGTNGFCRTKIGIGRPRFNEPIEDFVLSPVYENDREAIKGVLHIAVKAIESFVLEGAECAMNKFNAITTS